MQIFEHRVTSVYTPASFDQVKSISKSGWHPEERYWTLPYSKAIIEELLSIFDGKKLDFASAYCCPPKRKQDYQLIF
ncbi:MAG: hypothetical protein SWO11_13580 [Thermodesulfobacteriota bacterium]|nr:hypothetical protein [Thermodesulfobacteriota bacterium]